MLVEETMRFGIHVPNFGDFHDLRATAELARRAEDAGWDGFFLWDHMQYGKTTYHSTVDPWVGLAAIAMQTERIRLGPLVTPIPRRRPWKLARETVSIDHLSGGRLILGVGLGFPPDAEFEYFGEDSHPQVRAQKLDEGLDVLTGLWSGKPFAYTGRHYTVKQTRFRPTPLQQPRIPIWVAGYWAKSKAPFRRAARWDGVCPGQIKTPADVRAMVEYIGQYRTSAAPFDIVHFADIPKGTAAEVRARLEPWAEAGVTWWIVGTSGRSGAFQSLRQCIIEGPPKIDT
jgi:alkanesulfonate monooxygenase SsuD/methylene tetrahydromethanopterin reductase-like flavin-dependent oxidoreductase (luciferase family)